MAPCCVLEPRAHLKQAGACSVVRDCCSAALEGVSRAWTVLHGERVPGPLSHVCTGNTGVGTQLVHGQSCVGQGLPHDTGQGAGRLWCGPHVPCCPPLLRRQLVQHRLGFPSWELKPAGFIPQAQSPVAQGPVAQSPVAQSPVAQGAVAQGPVAQCVAVLGRGTFQPVQGSPSRDPGPVTSIPGSTLQRSYFGLNPLRCPGMWATEAQRCLGSMKTPS